MFRTQSYSLSGSCKENDTPWHFTVRTLSKSDRFRTRKHQNDNISSASILMFSRSKTLGLGLGCRSLHMIRLSSSDTKPWNPWTTSTVEVKRTLSNGDGQITQSNTEGYSKSYHSTHVEKIKCSLSSANEYSSCTAARKQSYWTRFSPVEAPARILTG